MVVCDRGLRSFAGFLVVVVVEQPGPWCSIVVRGSQDRGLMDSGSLVRVPAWWVGVGVTARGGQVPGQTLSSQLNYPPQLEDRIKTRRGPFYFGVCVCVCGANLLSRIV